MRQREFTFIVVQSYVPVPPGLRLSPAGLHDRLFGQPTHAHIEEVSRHMPKHATVRLQPLQTCLVNLPLSLYGQLVSRSVTPQSLVVCLSFGSDKGGSSSKRSSSALRSKDSRNGNVEGKRVYVGWSGMPSRLVGGVSAIGKGQEALEMDPVCAKELGLADGMEVRCAHSILKI